MHGVKCTASEDSAPPCAIFQPSRRHLFSPNTPLPQTEVFICWVRYHSFLFRGASCHSIAFLPTTAKNTSVQFPFFVGGYCGSSVALAALQPSARHGVSPFPILCFRVGCRHRVPRAHGSESGALCTGQKIMDCMIVCRRIDDHFEGVRAVLATDCDISLSIRYEALAQPSRMVGTAFQSDRRRSATKWAEMQRREMMRTALHFAPQKYFGSMVDCLRPPRSCGGCF